MGAGGESGHEECTRLSVDGARGWGSNQARGAGWVRDVRLPTAREGARSPAGGLRAEQRQLLTRLCATRMDAVLGVLAQVSDRPPPLHPSVVRGSNVYFELTYHIHTSVVVATPVNGFFVLRNAFILFQTTLHSKITSFSPLSPLSVNTVRKPLSFSIRILTSCSSAVVISLVRVRVRGIVKGSCFR